MPRRPTFAVLRDIEEFTPVDGNWRRLDERIEKVSSEIEALAKQDESCQRLISAHRDHARAAKWRGTIRFEVFLHVGDWTG